MKRTDIALTVLAGSLGSFVGCAKKQPSVAITVDGSSTVFPITQAAAEQFHRSDAANPPVVVRIAGTGGGFRKFCAGETDINDASRPINATEAAQCAQSGVDYIELPIAYDGIAVVVNAKNTWATELTVAELKKIWEPDAQGKVTRWNQIRPSWPDKPLRLFGAGGDSGTYDYFTDAIVGREHVSRTDYTSSEDDNALVRGIEQDENALGFFGLSYYDASKTQLRVVPINDEREDNGVGPIAPSATTVKNGTYQPLSRPLFLYVSRKSIVERTEVNAFVWFYLANGPQLVSDAKYIPLPNRAYGLAKKRADTRKTGSVFGGTGSQVGVSIESLLEKQ